MFLLANTLSNVLALSFLDVLDVLSFLLYVVRETGWMSWILYAVRVLGVPLFDSNIPHFLEHQAIIGDCLVAINDVYVVDKLSLTGINLDKARGPRPYELRISKYLDIGVGWEVDCAYWARKQFLRTERFVGRCKVSYCEF
jgi:hypothetical protein